MLALSTILRGLSSRWAARTCRASAAFVVVLMGCTADGRVGRLDGAAGGGAAGSSAAGSAGAAGATGLPPWLADRPLFTWVPIPGSEGAGQARVDAFSGMAVRGDTGEIWIAAAGGGHDGYDNRVVVLRLTDSEPRWELRHAASTLTAPDVSHYPDGTPASREVYHAIHWSPVARRVLLTGLRYTFPSNVTFPTVDGFDPATDLWDAAGTWASMPTDPFHGFGMVQDGAGRIWTDQLARFDPATNTWSPPLASHPVPTRFPASFDGLRNELFTLMVGDGQGYETPAVHASRIALGDDTALVQEPITLAPGPGLDALTAQTPTYAAMAHDPNSGDHYFYEGYHEPGRVLAVTPRSSGEWPVRVLSLSSSAGTPPPCLGSGIQNRFQYVAVLKGFVLLPQASSELWFFRVA